MRSGSFSSGFHQSAYSSQWAVVVAHSNCALISGQRWLERRMVGFAERCGPYPPARAANLHHINHHIIGGFGVDGVLHAAHTHQFSPH
jgi:hypothetical protein